MILRYNLPGYKTYLKLPVKMGVLAVTFTIPLSVYYKLDVFSANVFLSSLIFAGLVFTIVLCALIILMEFEFRHRKDNYIFQGYFPLKLHNITLLSAIHLLKEMGYQDSKTDGEVITLQRRNWPGKNLTENPADIRHYLVEIKKIDTEVHMKFYDPKLEHQFDGRQIAYKAAQEFLLKSNLAVNS